MLTDKDIRYLKSVFKKYEQGNATVSESHFVNVYFDYLDELNKDDSSFTTLSQEVKQELGEEIKKQVLQSIHDVGYTKNSKAAYNAKIIASRGFRYKWYTAAAVFLILFGTGAYVLFFNKKEKQSAAPVVYKKLDIPPGSNKAILKLANGQQILLDSAQGNIVQNGNLNVSNSGGKLDYEGRAGAIEYHTLSTPRGGDYKLKLPDGTQVWLNAESSITFPTAFTGTDRKVTITGEVFFEVKHNVNKPFIVQANNILIKDIGTAFNVNAYDDEPSVKTTLAEGLVQVSTGSSDKILKPGMQSIVQHGNGEITVANVNVADVIAWKNGLTVFDNSDLQTIMRQVSRWYDVDVVFEGTVPGKHFEGGISRKSNLSELLKVLEFENVNFSIEGKKIVVRP